MFQGLILRLHDVPNSSHDVPNNVFLCVWCNCRGKFNLNCVFCLIPVMMCLTMYFCVFGAIVEASLI